MRHLLGCWPEVATRFRNARAIALFLDFDGTLAAYRPKPEEARLPPATRRALHRLVRCPSLRVWVISGRRRADVRSRVLVPGVHCLGLYGWEDGENGALRGTALSLLAQARSALAGPLQVVSGVWVEDKGAAFVLHFRGAAEDSVRRARAVLDRALEPFATGLHVIDEDRARTVLPRQLKGKGDAVRKQWRAFNPAALPVYIGGGTPDEAAFVEVARGVTVCVGPRRKTHARFRLRDPAEVCCLLEKLETEVR